MNRRHKYVHINILKIHMHFIYVQSFIVTSVQEETEFQQKENKDAALAVAKRQRMLERERESIERKPFLDMKIETKRFRQDVFKRRHRARVLKSQGLSLSGN